jgi:hypothetical protein
MQHLLLFESYFNRLDEISFSDHWIERTSLKDPESRTVPYDPDYQYGFKMTGFLDSRGNNISLIEGIKMIGLDITVLTNYLSNALYILTNSKKLEDWKPAKSEATQILDLGRICFYKEGIELFPIIKGGRGPEEQGAFYEEGENIWGLVKKNTEGITIKYYSAGDKGKVKMYEDSYRDANKKSKISKVAFLNNTAYGYPYGENFKLIVDLSDNKELSIYNKLKAQVGKGEWELGPTKEKEIKKVEANYDDREFKRLQLSNGLIIGIINQETGKANIYEVYGDPINTNDMLSNYLRDKEEKTNLLKQTPVIFKAYPITEMKKYNGPNVMSSYSRASSITKTVTLNPEDQVYIKRAKKGSPLDPDQIYRFKFVTSEPKILQKGSAQIALDIV